MVSTSLRGYARPVDIKHLVAGVAVWAAAASIFFRHPILSSFGRIFGDPGDGSMIIYLHEHLFNVLQGRAELTSPPFFYPQGGVLGLGPAFLLDAVPYSTLRLLECDPFLSFQLLLMILSLASFMASLVICLRYLNIRISIALCAAVLMTFANNLFVKAWAGHPNFLMLYYIPCIVLIALWGIEDFPRVTRWSIARVATAAALYALLFSTDVYTAWLFGLTLLIAAGAVGVMHGRSLLSAARLHLRPALILVATAAIAFLIAFIPFVMIYVPIRTIAPLRGYREYLLYAPAPKDIIDVSSGNLLWGWLVQILLGERGPEKTLAITPGMTALFLFLAYRVRKNSTHVSQWPLAFVTISVAVWLMSWLLTAKIGTASGFWLLGYLVPGAGGIRAGMRVQLIVNLWLVLGLGLLLEYWIRTAPIAQFGNRKWFAAGALLFCLIEQINLMNAGRLDRPGMLKLLSTVPRPPAECGTFLVSTPDGNPNYIQQVEAMWISNQIGLPTLNGLASWVPPGWQLDENTNYFGAARQWIAYSGLREKVCIYEHAERRWSPFQ